jgi:hypothetical protein
MIVTSMQLTISSRRDIAVLQKESSALEGEEDVNLRTTGLILQLNSCVTGTKRFATIIFEYAAASRQGSRHVSSAHRAMVKAQAQIRARMSTVHEGGKYPERRAQSFIGIPLAMIRDALATLPHGRTSTAADWRKLSANWKRRLDERIEKMMQLRDSLTGCIGCGCLSLKVCPLRNPRDRLGDEGPGPRLLEP